MARPREVRKSEVPRWLWGLVARYGSPARHPDLDRWDFQDGEIGVLTSHSEKSNVWQVVVWTPRRSVTVRSAWEPLPSEIEGAVSLAGLYDVPPMVDGVTG